MVVRSSFLSRRWLWVACAAVAIALCAWLAWCSLSKSIDRSVPLALREGRELVQSQHCLRCHGMVNTHVGPGFAQIAERYRGDPAALERLAGKIREGSAGVWGRKLMPRNPAISAEQAQTLAAWVLAQPNPDPENNRLQNR